MNIDFRKDAADLQAFIIKALTDYGKTPSSDRGRKIDECCAYGLTARSAFFLGVEPEASGLQFCLPSRRTFAGGPEGPPLQPRFD